MVPRGILDMEMATGPFLAQISGRLAKSVRFQDFGSFHQLRYELAISVRFRG